MAVIGKRINKKRVWEIDFLRGFCILLMVFDHAMFDFMLLGYMSSNFFLIERGFFYEMFYFAEAYWYWDVRVNVRFGVVFLFLILSGISCRFSRSDTRRLYKLSLAALTITVVTIITDIFFQLGVAIVFGILHIIALSVAFYMLLKKSGADKYAFLALGWAIFLAGFLIPFWDIGSIFEFSAINSLRLLVGTKYYGSDCYGIVPYTGLFFIGVYLGQVLYEDKPLMLLNNVWNKPHSLIPALDRAWHKPITFVGRNTIWVYLLHQVVVFVAVFGSAALMGYTF